MKYIETSEHDRELSARWTQLDLNHIEMKPDFWLPPLDAEGQPIRGIKCLRVEDNVGTVFFLRLENVFRAYIQFPPEAEVSAPRIGSALKRLFFFLSRGGKQAGYHESIFDSKSKTLISFFKHFGFEEMKDTFKVKL